MKVYVGEASLYGGRVWVVDHDRRTPLTHHSKHSPTGFSWGYAGSGPADLARCLLIDHLGTKAACANCEGTGKYREAGEVVPCWECGATGFKLPVSYMDFKFEVVAGLPSPGWTLSEDVIAKWVEGQLAKAN